MMIFHKYILFIWIPGILTKSIQKVGNGTEDLNSIKKELENLKASVHNLSVLVEHGPHQQQGIMFFVKLSSATTLNKNSIVKFDTVIVDEGNNFNAGNGIFVSPVSEIYQFSWTQFVQNSKFVDTELRVDNVIVDSLYAYIGTSTGMPATKVVIYKVKKGDHVWVQTSRFYAENLFYTPHASRSSFMGLLLQAI